MVHTDNSGQRSPSRPRIARARVLDRCLTCNLYFFFFFLMTRRPPISPLFPHPPLSRSGAGGGPSPGRPRPPPGGGGGPLARGAGRALFPPPRPHEAPRSDRRSLRLSAAVRDCGVAV